jgi:hypothetical protein
LQIKSGLRNPDTFINIDCLVTIHCFVPRMLLMVEVRVLIACDGRLNQAAHC